MAIEELRELVTELTTALGLRANADDFTPASAAKRAEQRPTAQAILDLAPKQADAWLLAAYCGGDLTRALENAWAQRLSLGDLIPEAETWARLAADGVFRVQAAYRVPFLPDASHAMTVPTADHVDVTTEPRLGMARAAHQYDRHNDADLYLRDVAKVAALRNTSEDPDDPWWLIATAIVHCAHADWESCLAWLASADRACTVKDMASPSSIQMMRLASLVGLGRLDYARTLSFELNKPHKFTLGETGVHRLLHTAILEGLADSEEARADARVARQMTASLEADVPAVAQLIALPRIALPKGSAADVAARTTRDDPYSRRTDDDSRRADALAQALAELDQLVGLDRLRSQIRRFVNQARIARARERADLAPTSAAPGHWVFTGPPGTGKTTVARIMARLLYGLGQTEDPDVFVSTLPSNLIGKYLGHSAPQTHEQVMAALGGVLFIDEAYQLTDGRGSSGDQDKFGNEVVTQLLADMENLRGQFVLIVAGYGDEMQRFLGSNPGLAGRFTHRLEFDSYSPDELMRIVTDLASRDQFTLTPAAENWLWSSLRKLEPGDPEKLANGRFARELYGRLTGCQADRVADAMGEGDEPSRADLTTITDQDVRRALLPPLAAADNPAFLLPFPTREEAPPREFAPVAPTEREEDIRYLVRERVEAARALVGVERTDWSVDLDDVAQFWAAEYARDHAAAPTRAIKLEQLPLDRGFMGGYGWVLLHDTQGQSDHQIVSRLSFWSDPEVMRWLLAPEHPAHGIGVSCTDDGNVSVYFLALRRPVTPAELARRGAWRDATATDEDDDAAALAAGVQRGPQPDDARHMFDGPAS